VIAGGGGGGSGRCGGCLAFNSGVRAGNGLVNLTYEPIATGPNFTG